MSIESMMPSNHFILCCSLLLLPSIFPSIRVFPMRWPKYWSFSNSPSNEYSGLMSFRIDWLDLLAAQGTLKSLLQHHSSKASILWHSAFFMVQLSHPYMTTGKPIALTIPGIKPTSPALAGGFLTTGPPRKSQEEELVTHMRSLLPAPLSFLLSELPQGSFKNPRALVPFHSSKSIFWAARMPHGEGSRSNPDSVPLYLCDLCALNQSVSSITKWASNVYFPEL